MTYKSKSRIKKEVAELRKFLEDFPDGKMLICERFNYNTTQTVERWLVRGIPSYLYIELSEYIKIQYAKPRKKRA